MKNVLLAFLVLLSTSSYADGRADKIEQLNQQLKAHQGSVIYLDFWASWCIPCRKSFPWMNEMVAQYQAKGLTVLSVNLDADKQNAAEFLAQFPANFPVIYDPKGYIGRAFKLPGMPSSMLFDRSGQLIATHVGFNEQKKAQYQQEIITLLAQ